MVIPCYTYGIIDGNYPYYMVIYGYQARVARYQTSHARKSPGHRGSTCELPATGSARTVAGNQWVTVEGMPLVLDNHRYAIIPYNIPI